MSGGNMQIKEIKEFLDYLRYNLNYSEKTIVSYEHDIENFYLFIFSEPMPRRAQGIALSGMRTCRVLRGSESSRRDSLS